MSARLFFVVGGLFLGAFLAILGARAVLPGSGGGSPTPAATPTATGFAIIVPPISSLLSGPILPDPIAGGTAVVGATRPPPTSAPTQVATATPAPTVLIEANWPPSMAEGNSDTVVIWLIQTREKFYVAEIERAGQTAVPATLVPRGTPDVPYAQAYGPDYKLVSASAVLAATNIDIVPVGDTRLEYPLDEARIGWVWNISPRKQGKQVMTAEVRFRWESGVGEPKELSVWQYTLDMLVTPPETVQAITVNGPSASQSGTGTEQVGFWADALQVVTGLGAIMAFAGGAMRWGLGRVKEVTRG